MTSQTSALQLYRSRLQGREQGVAQLERTEQRLGSLRVASFIVAIAAAWWLLNRDPVLAVVAHSSGWRASLLSSCMHGRVKRSIELAQRAAAFYRAGLARIEDRWNGTGQTGERFDDPHHVYAADLDLFGRGSLFELLFTGRTRMGEECLARWLLAPATVATIRERQAAIVELRERHRPARRHRGARRGRTSRRATRRTHRRGRKHRID